MSERGYREIFDSQVPVPKGWGRALRVGRSDTELDALFAVLADEPERADSRDGQRAISEAADILAARDADEPWRRNEFVLGRLGVEADRAAWAQARRQAALGALRAQVADGAVDVAVVSGLVVDAGDGWVFERLDRSRREIVAGMPPAYLQMCALAARRAGGDDSAQALAALLSDADWRSVIELALQDPQDAQLQLSRLLRQDLARAEH